MDSLDGFPHQYARNNGISRLFFQGILILLMIGIVGLAHAGKLTTFEEYAAMSIEERGEVRGRAMGIVFGQAARLKDEQRKQCLRETFLLDFGDKEEVTLAHAKLRGILEAGIKYHDVDSRVEYAIAHHLKEVCPPKEVVTISR